MSDRSRGCRTLLVVIGLVAGLAIAGCDAPAESPGDELLPQDAAAAVRIGLIPVAGLGDVLADGDGYVLYMFPPDAGARVTCTGPCAGSWPPLAIGEDGEGTAGKGVDQGLIGTMPDPNTGGRVVTYAGHPLYRYAGDVDPGTANGQALILNGGPWYVLAADGQPLTIDPDGAP